MHDVVQLVVVVVVVVDGVLQCIHYFRNVVENAYTYYDTIL